MRRLGLVLFALAVAGCGGTKPAEPWRQPTEADIQPGAVIYVQTGTGEPRPLGTVISVNKAARTVKWKRAVDNDETTVRYDPFLGGSAYKVPTK